MADPFQLAATVVLVLPDGFVRDTVMDSITEREWPEVRGKLEDKEARSRDR